MQAVLPALAICMSAPRITIRSWKHASSAAGRSSIAHCIHASFMYSITSRICCSSTRPLYPVIIRGMLRSTRREFVAAALLASRLRALPLAEIKLGVTTDEIDDDVSTAARFLHDHGLHWAEVRNIWGPYNTSQPM